MLENFSSLVEFFAAVYVTMTINNDYCENFWTPQYYKEMEHLLDKFKFNTSSTSNKELINAIKTTYQKIQGNARRRGAVMLWFCVMVLIYIGFEDDNAICAKAIIHYKPLFYSQSILLLIVLFPNYLMKSWRWVSFWIFTITVFYALVKYTDIGLYFDNSLLEWGYSSSKSILLGMLLFPVLYQTLLFWEYSRMYKGYLGNKVQIEYEKYTKSLAGIQTGDKDKVDPEYKSVYGDYIITNRSNEDNSLEQFNKLLYSRLLNAASPSQFSLLYSYVRYKFNHVYNREIAKNYNHSREVITVSGIKKTSSSNFQNVSRYKKTVLLDFSKEYDDYLLWKRTVKGPHKGITDYCNCHSIDSKAMIAWLKITRPQTKSKIINQRM